MTRAGIDPGRPGEYAQDRFERARSRERLKLRAALPLLIGVGLLSMAIVFLGFQPLFGSAVASLGSIGIGLVFMVLIPRMPMESLVWLKGAEGERRTASFLEPLRERGFVVLFGRLVPGSREDIDALVVGPTGVFIVETKTWKRGAEVRNHHVFVGASDRTSVVQQVYRQAVAVQIALGGVLTEKRVSVCPVLSLTNGVVTAERVAAGVDIVTSKHLASALLDRPTVLDQVSVDTIALAAHHRLGQVHRLTTTSTPPAQAPAQRPSPEALRAEAGSAQAQSSEAEQATFEALRRWRRQVADAEGVPPYVVFHDTTLWAIARSRPEDPPALAGISGVGPAKLERYGSSLLALLREHPIETR